VAAGPPPLAAPPVPAPPSAQLPALSPAPPPAPAPAQPAIVPPVATPPTGRETASVPSSPAPTLRESVQGLSLDVLVYSDVPAQRLVFISGQKYVEGQQIDERLVLEAITPEGAVLAREGQRYLLRPKTNPYVR
jgi:hypothetical protein